MDKIRNILKEIIERVFSVEVDVEVTLAPELDEKGINDTFSPDFATNVAMKLAGELRKRGEKANPREIAETLKTEFLSGIDGKHPEFHGTKVEVAGPGFLNFTPGDEFYSNFIGEFGEKFENFNEKTSLDEYFGKTVICEFSDPNPFKVLHVGHLYTSIVGDSISRLIENAGGRVVRANFGGDVGLHVAKTIYAIRLNNLSNVDFTIEDIARAYVEGTRAYEEDEEAKQRIVQLNKIIYKISELGEGNCDNLKDDERAVAEIYWNGRKLSYRYFENFYKTIGVKFDKFYPESSVAKIGLKKVLEQKEKGVYTESDGAVVFKGEDFGLHTRVFVNKAGLPTYEAKDVGLLFAKWADYEFDESVVITGNDITDYMKVVLKSIEQYAPELVAKTTHITHGNVRLPGNEKMSSRKGNFVKAVDVLDMVRRALPGEKEDEISSDETIVLDSVALGAVKYFFLKYKIGGDIIFDVEESVSLNGNSGPYLQYSAVRAKKILSKLGADDSNEVVSNFGMSVFERKLNKKFVQYPEVLRGATREKAPHLVASYLFELAQDFSRFYENCKVAGDEREAQRRKFVELFTKIMEHGLNILGIDIPESM